MASITATGIGSGLDIGGLVSQLVSAEGAPALRRLERQQLEATAELSALGTLKSALSALRTSVEKLSDPAAFQVLSATSSQESLVRASASEQAAPGRYQVEVLSLAERHKVGSATFDPAQAVGGTAGDRLEITAGGTTFSVDLAAGSTLAGIRDAINAAAENPGVSATLLNVDDSRQVLMLTASGTGQANAVAVTETLAGGPSLGLATANLDGSGQPLADLAGLDAAVRIDGIEVTRSSNRLADVIDGVTLDLVKAEPGTRVAVAIDPDLEAVAGLVSGLVDRYNELVGVLKGVAGYKGQGATQPALFGDAMTGSLSGRLRTELGRSVSGLGGSFAALSEIGVTTTAEGRLQVDREALDAALADGPGAVGALFHSEQGLAAGLEAVIAPFLRGDGILESRSDGLERRLDRIEDSRETLDRRLAALEERYLRQFSAMDALVGQLQATSEFLSRQFAAVDQPR